MRYRAMVPFLVALLAAIAGFVAIGNRPEPPPNPIAAPLKSTTRPTHQRVMAPAKAGKPYPMERATARIVGRVRLNGPVPKRPPIDCKADPKIGDMYKDQPMLSESIVADSNGGLKNAIVFVDQGLEGYTFATPEEPIVVRSVRGRYEPHTFGIMVGQPLWIKNEDPTAHNPHELRDTFSKPQAGKGDLDRYIIEVPEFGGLKCDIHPWMNANYICFEHPLYCVTSEDGSYEIKNLIPGEYKIKVWHQRLKENETTVRISANETRTVDFEYKIDAKKP